MIDWRHYHLHPIGSVLREQHDPEKWPPVSRLREALPVAIPYIRRYGGRRQVG
jgi:hypothetical protein